MSIYLFIMNDCYKYFINTMHILIVIYTQYFADIDILCEMTYYNKKR